MKIGFTGTDKGMSLAQAEQVRIFLDTNYHDELHHGDCIGADAEASEIARTLNMVIVSHPPTNSRSRAFCTVAYSMPELPYLERNKAIVTETDWLIAAPSEYHEILRSGTWATVRYARKIGRETVIVYPDGSIVWEIREEENG